MSHYLANMNDHKAGCSTIMIEPDCSVEIEIFTGYKVFAAEALFPFPDNKAGTLADSVTS